MNKLKSPSPGHRISVVYRHATRIPPTLGVALGCLLTAALLLIAQSPSSLRAQVTTGTGDIVTGQSSDSSASLHEAAGSSDSSVPTSDASVSSLHQSSLGDSDAGQAESSESSLDPSASSLGPSAEFTPSEAEELGASSARDDTSNGARDDALTVSSDSSLSSASSSEISSEGSSSTSAEPPLDSARGEAGSESSVSSSTPPVTLDIPEASLLANTNTHVFVRIGRSKGITTRDELAARLILDFASLTGPEVLPEWDVSDATGSEGGYVLRLAMPRSFTPGLFRLRVGMDTTPGETRAIQRMFRAINGGEAGEAPLLEQTFAMGHAAANTNRGTYLAGEALEAQMAVSDGVLPLCGSALGAELTDPAGGRQAFSIALGNLQYQKSCATRKFTVLPDYALTSPL
ncbi:MAG: hypothetical protein AAB728_03615, partial [Patescibacteria group bacterium]